MFVFFHKGVRSNSIYGITDRFTPLDKHIFITTVIEPDDQVWDWPQLRMTCDAAGTTTLDHQFPLTSDFNAHTAWFDVERITNRKQFPLLPLTARIWLGDQPFVECHARLENNNTYSVLGGRGR